MRGNVCPRGEAERERVCCTGGTQAPAFALPLVDELEGVFGRSGERVFSADGDGERLNFARGRERRAARADVESSEDRENELDDRDDALALLHAHTAYTIAIS